MVTDDDHNDDHYDHHDDSTAAADDDVTPNDDRMMEVEAADVVVHCLQFVVEVAAPVDPTAALQGGPPPIEETTSTTVFGETPFKKQTKKLLGPMRTAITETNARIHDYPSYAMDGNIGPKFSKIKKGVGRGG